MAKDKSSKTSAGKPEDSNDGASTMESQAPTKRRRGIFAFLRSEKSKTSKTRPGKVQVELSSDQPQNNNHVTRSASFSEQGSSKEPTRKVHVKRHLSVSRSGKMKEVRKRPSINELTKRFETQAQV